MLLYNLGKCYNLGKWLGADAAREPLGRWWCGCHCRGANWEPKLLLVSKKVFLKKEMNCMVTVLVSMYLSLFVLLGQKWSQIWSILEALEDNMALKELDLSSNEARNINPGWAGAAERFHRPDIFKGTVIQCDSIRFDEVYCSYLTFYDQLFCLELFFLVLVSSQVGDLGGQSMGLLLKKEPRLSSLSLKSNQISIPTAVGAIAMQQFEPAEHVVCLKTKGIQSYHPMMMLTDSYVWYDMVEVCISSRQSMTKLG